MTNFKIYLDSGPETHGLLQICLHSWKALTHILTVSDGRLLNFFRGFSCTRKKHILPISWSDVRINPQQHKLIILILLGTCQALTRQKSFATEQTFDIKEDWDRFCFPSPLPPDIYMMLSPEGVSLWGPITSCCSKAHPKESFSSEHFLVTCQPVTGSSIMIMAFCQRKPAH